MRVNLAKSALSILLITFVFGFSASGIKAAETGVTISNPITSNDFISLLGEIIKWLFWIAIPITSLMIVFAAFQLLTSGGDPQKVATAKKMIIWALVGLTIIYLSGALVDLLKNLLGVKKIISMSTLR